MKRMSEVPITSTVVIEARDKLGLDIEKARAFLFSKLKAPPTSSIPVAASIADPLVTKTKGKCGRPPGSKNLKGPSTKMPSLKVSSNYSEIEDVCIAKAFVAATTDPTKGTNQKSEDFWGTVHDNFYKFMEKEDRTRLEQQKRISKLLMDCFQRKISKDTTEFNAFYIRSRKQQKSGWVDADYLNDALASYENDKGYPFAFAKCLPILWQLPKYSWEGPLAKAFVDDGADVATQAHSKVGSVQGSTLEKPQGSKAAKRLKLVEVWRESAEEKRLLERKETNKTLRVIGGAQVGMNSTYHLQEESETRTRLISFYLRLGKEEEAMRLMQEEEVLLEEKKQARLARAEADRRAMAELQPCNVTNSGMDDDDVNVPQDVVLGCGSPNSDMSPSSDPIVTAEL